MKSLGFFSLTLRSSSGLHLSKEKRDEITAVKKKISELGTKYSSNLNEDTTFLEFDESELTGVPEDLIKSFEKASKRYILVWYSTASRE